MQAPPVHHTSHVLCSATPITLPRTALAPVSSYMIAIALMLLAFSRFCTLSCLVSSSSARRTVLLRTRDHSNTTNNNNTVAAIVCLSAYLLACLGDTVQPIERGASCSLLSGHDPG